MQKSMPRLRDHDLRSLVALDAMAGQRRRGLDADHPRVGIRGRGERADCDQPAGHRDRHVGGGAAGAERQGGGERPRGGCGAGCRRAVDRSEGRRVGAAGAVGMRGGGEAVPRGRAGDLHHRRSAPSTEGQRIRNREPRGGACHRVRPDPSNRQCWRPGLHSRRRPGGDHVDRGRE